MGANVQTRESRARKNSGSSSSIARLDQLERHLSQAPSLARKSKMESFFAEINYSSFGTEHRLKTSLKPNKNGNSARLHRVGSPK